jgi:CHASE2 domain-containing sensor protein
MLWVALFLGAVAFLILRVRGSSTTNAILGGLGLVAVLSAIAISQEGWDIPVPILILMGAIGGSLASAAAERERHDRRGSRRLT